jgi:O-methyltransferase involved in polyketide biosynthesis
MDSTNRPLRGPHRNRPQQNRPHNQHGPRNPQHPRHQQNRIRIQLGELQSSLLIPLYGRAKDFEKQRPLVKDKLAHDIVEKLDFDFAKAFSKLPPQIVANGAIRAHHVDTALRDFIGTYPEATIVNLGAGLDTTFRRVDNGRIFWYDLDLADTIQLRRKLIQEGKRNKMLSFSLLDRTWFKHIKARRSKIFFVAAGIFVYFKKKEVRQLLVDMAAEFPDSEIMFESYSKLFLFLRNNWFEKQKGDEKSEMLTRMRWGVGSAGTIGGWSEKIQVVDEFPFYSRIKLQEYWDKKLVSSLRFMNFFRLMKMMHLRFGK